MIISTSVREHFEKVARNAEILRAQRARRDAILNRQKTRPAEHIAPRCPQGFWTLNLDGRRAAEAYRRRMGFRQS